MLLSDLLQEVYAETKRPDLSVLTISKIREATQFLHGADDWKRDLLSVQFSLPSAMYETNLDIGFIQRRRRIYQVIPLGADTQPLERADISEFSNNSTGEVMPHCFYEFGNTVGIKSAYPTQQLVLWFYAFPEIGSSDETYKSWIADINPYAIILYATYYIFQSLNHKSARDVAARAQEKLRMMQQNMIG